MRWWVVAFHFASLASADSLSVDDSFPDSTRPTLEALADDVWNVVMEMFHSSPPLDLPVRVHQSNASAPLTRVLKGEISIRITSRGTHYAQFAFQLGHELGHVTLDPRRANGIVEAICIAVSYEVLDRLGDEIRMSPAYVWLSDYAPNFAPYRENDQKITLAKMPEEVRALVANRDWSGIASYLRDHRREMEPGEPAERILQTLAAVALRSGAIDWSELTGIAGCTVPPPEEDPRVRILPIREDCIARLPEVFCRIGIGCAR